MQIPVLIRFAPRANRREKERFHSTTSFAENGHTGTKKEKKKARRGRGERKKSPDAGGCDPSRARVEHPQGEKRETILKRKEG